MSCFFSPTVQVPEKGVPLSPASLSVTLPESPPLVSSCCAACAGACPPKLLSKVTADTVTTRTRTLWISILVSPLQGIRVLSLPYLYGWRVQRYLHPLA